MIDLSVLPHELKSILHERGHSYEDIAHMTVEKAFDEWLGWTLGDPRWGDDFRRIQGALKNAEVPKTR